MQEPFTMNVLSLAYLGDAVYERLVRARLIRQEALPAGQLHREAMRYVSAPRQSLACSILVPLLRPDELSVFRRARNANSLHAPRHASLGDYHHATALEAVFGYLELRNEQERIQALFDPIFEYLTQAEAISSR